MRHFDVVIAGGGAAGLMAAGIAAGKGYRVLLCEKMEKPARKVRITGKGRCNLTNMRTEAEFLEKIRASAEFFKPAFQLFSNKDTVHFFESIGVPLTVERGERVFPTSGKAWDIADAHVQWCKREGAVIECNTRIAAIHTENRQVSGITLEKTTSGDSSQKEHEEITTQNVIIATGGVSYPATGSTGDGFLLADQLGHTVIPLRPSLVPLESRTSYTERLNGLSLKNVSVRLMINGKLVATEFGEMEFTSFGVSGPVILRLSRMAVDALNTKQRVELSIDLKPALNNSRLAQRMEREIAAARPGTTLRDLLRTMLPAKMIGPFVEEAGRKSGASMNKVNVQRLTKGEQALVMDLLKNFVLPITDYRPFEEAIVTAGGISTEEIDRNTLQSIFVSGLYFAGEVLDIDADTGGYNLQIAYSTGYLAGQLLKTGGTGKAYQ